MSLTHIEMMLAFVSVGSTRFDALISVVFTDGVLSNLHQKGYTKLVVQCGNSMFELADSIRNGETKTLRRAGVDIEYWMYKASLEEEYAKADLVISHAGSGTILDVLRKGKSMIVVPNPTLLDNHQEELATTLEEMGYLRAASLQDLPAAIDAFEASSIKPFPPFDGSRFARIVDEAMGFI